MTPRVEPPSLRPVDVSAAAFEGRARARLSFDLAPSALDAEGAPAPRGDHLLDDLAPRLVPRPRAAAVLIPVVARPAGATVLLTLRTAHLRAHSGQIAFPGGQIDAADPTPAAAALREAEEEVGLDPRTVTPLGYLAPYLTRTGYVITPVVSVVREPKTLVLNAAEVADAFEVPLAFLMDAANHRRAARELNGVLHTVFEMPWRERLIWGITAALIRDLYERLYL